MPCVLWTCRNRLKRDAEVVMRNEISAKQQQAELVHSSALVPLSFEPEVPLKCSVQYPECASIPSSSMQTK